MDAYETRPGSTQPECAPERRMLAEGSIHALTFTSTAEVSRLQASIHPVELACSILSLLHDGRLI